MSDEPDDMPDEPDDIPTNPAERFLWKKNRYLRERTELPPDGFTSWDSYYRYHARTTADPIARSTLQGYINQRDAEGYAALQRDAERRRANHLNEGQPNRNRGLSDKYFIVGDTIMTKAVSNGDVRAHSDGRVIDHVYKGELVQVGKAYEDYRGNTFHTWGSYVKVITERGVEGWVKGEHVGYPSGYGDPWD